MAYWIQPRRNVSIRVPALWARWLVRKGRATVHPEDEHYDGPWREQRGTCTSCNREMNEDEYNRHVDAGECEG